METYKINSSLRKKILVVDDNHDILELITVMLESRGFDVCTHDTGLHVEDIVKQSQPDLILLDVALPGKYGTQVCRELKMFCDTPIILFSAHANLQECQQECNAEAFISKPFDIHDFMRTINLYLN